jgi:hypothetical protein
MEAYTGGSLDAGVGEPIVNFAAAFSRLSKAPPPRPPSAKVAHDVLAPSVVAQEFIDPQRFTNYYFNQVLCTNQIDIVGALTSQERTTITVEPRQVGKTSSVAVSAAINCETEGAAWNKDHAEPYRIGIFAPKASQAQLDTDRLKAWCRCTKQGRDLIDWEQTTNDRIVWHNGSEIRTYSASEQAENDGKTLNRIILEEGQKISDFVVSQSIMPMGGATGAKIAKIGTVRPIRNHFFNTWHSDKKALRTWHHWLICDNLLRGGYVEYGGRKISKYVLDMMPLAQKETYIRAGIFPNTPDFYYPSQDMELNDFLTQYELRWLEQFGLFLDGREKAILLSGAQPHQQKQMSMAEELYVGIDFATGVGADETAIAVWKRTGQVLCKVWGCTFSDMSAPDQKREILNLFSKQGPFHSVRLILGDFGGNGAAIIPEIAAEANLPAQTINFGASDKTIVGASMNMKTSMFMDFKRQLQMGWLRYPVLNNSTPMELTMDYQKGVRQWSALEQEIIGVGINRRIQSPESDHDDICCADVLAVRAAKLGPAAFGQKRANLGRLPFYILSSQFR